MKRLALLLILLSSTALADPSIQVEFSPGNAAEAVVQAISEAKSTIELAAYSFSSRPIAEALVSAEQRGVHVEAILDKSNATAHYSAATLLTNAGIPTRIDSRYAIFHHKFLIIDGKTVETGSFNMTKAATVANAENVVVMRDYPEVAQRFDAEWQRLWQESEDYHP